MQEVRALVDAQLTETGIEHRISRGHMVHTSLIGSPLQLRQIMVNLFSNAIKYNKDNGKIIMEFQEAQEDQDTVRIQFKCKDTGIGMSESFQKKIYEPFAQEKVGARTVYGGTGLGMPITKKLIEKMGGTITFESEKEKGTTFVIKIPFKIDQDADRREEQETISEKSIKDLKILLVEDNELNMEIAEFLLEDEGAVLTKAWNGQEAVDIFKNSPDGTFDVILMDIMMPVMDGLTATRTIRGLMREEAERIPIIAMTANAFEEDRKRSMEAGMNGHVAKPLDMQEILKTIVDCIQHK